MVTNNPVGNDVKKLIVGPDNFIVLFDRPSLQGAAI